MNITNTHKVITNKCEKIISLSCDLEIILIMLILNKTLKGHNNVTAMNKYKKSHWLTSFKIGHLPHVK